MADLFHTILTFLSKKPLDGSLHDLRECVNGKLNKNDGIRASFQQFQNVIDFLEKKEYILFKRNVIENKKTGEPFNVKVKYGEDPTESNSEEADFNTTYPMASITLTGFNYITDRKKEKNKHRIYVMTFVVASSSCIATITNCYNNKIQDNLKNEITVKDSLLNLKTKENQQLHYEKNVTQFKMDSMTKLKIYSTIDSNQNTSK